MSNIIRTHGYTASYVDKPNLVNGPILAVCRTIKGENKGRYMEGEQARQWWKALQAESDCPKTQAALCRAIYKG